METLNTNVLLRFGFKKVKHKWWKDGFFIIETKAGLFIRDSHLPVIETTKHLQDAYQSYKCKQLVEPIYLLEK